MLARFKKYFSEYWLYFTIIILASILVFSNFYQYPQGEISTRSLLHLQETKYSLAQGSYYPYAAHEALGAALDPEVPFFGVLYLLNLFMPTKFAIIYYALINTILLGIAFFFLTKEFNFDSDSALIGSLILIFSSYWVDTIYLGWHSFNEPMIFLILAVLFEYRLIKHLFNNPSKIIYIDSALMGISMSLILICAGGVFLIFSGILITLFFLLFFEYPKVDYKIAKAAIYCILLVALVFLSLAGFKLIAAVDFFNKAQSHTNYSYEDFLWYGGVNLSPINILSKMITNARGSSIADAACLGVGTIGFIFFILSFLQYKSKKVIKLFILFMVILLIAGDTFITKLVFHVPFVNKMRDIDNLLIIAIIPLTLMCGFGYRKLCSFFQSHAKLIFYCTATALVLSFVIFSMHTIPKNDRFQKFMETDKFVDFLKQDKDLYRAHSYKMDFVASSVSQTTVQYGLYCSDWDLGNVFYSDYITFTGLAGRSPAMPKLRGLLNDKYILETSKDKLSNLYWDPQAKPIEESNYTGLKLLQRFDDDPGYENITAVYLNQYYLPRQYLVPDAIAIVAKNRDTLVGVSVQLASLDYFDPKKNVIITLEHDDPILDNVGIILHDGSLRRRANGDQYIADFSTVDLNKIKSYLSSSVSDKPQDVRLNAYKQEYREYELPNKGFLVMSESYYKLPDSWTSKFDGKKVPIYSAYGVLSVFYADAPGTLTMKYAPWYYEYGVPFAVFALVFWIFLILYLIRKNRSEQITN